MNKEKNILEQFESISSIEPSAEWNDKLMQKLNRSQRTSGNSSSKKLVLFATVVLLAVNLFSLSDKLKSDNEQQSREKLKNIANEFLISTSSSKY